MNVTPKTVSGRVVKTSIFKSEFSTLKVRDAPFDLPIQFRCCSFIESDQSIVSRPTNKRSAYALIRIDHWRMSFCSTGKPPRTDEPFTISSFAKTVPNLGHQFTQVSAK